MHWLVQHRLPEAAGNSSAAAAAVALYPSLRRLVRVLGEAFRITSASLLVAEPAQCGGVYSNALGRMCERGKAPAAKAEQCWVTFIDAPAALFRGKWNTLDVEVLH